MDIFNKLKMETAIKEAYSMMDEQIQLYKLTSKLMKEYYDALTEEGFTEVQALDIVKAHGIQAGRISGEEDTR